MWLGLHYAVPTTHILRSLATSQFFCDDAACPLISVPSATGPRDIAQSAYVQDFLGTSYTSRFQFGEVGWAALAVCVCLTIAAAANAIRSK